MKLAKLLFLCVLAVVSGSAAAKRAPIENIGFTPFDVQSGRAVEPGNVKAAVAEALRSWTGSIIEDRPGTMVLRLAPRTHAADIRFDYDPKGFRISYLSSENLDFKNEKGVDHIHRNYNLWVKQFADKVAGSPLLWASSAALAEYKAAPYDPSTPIVIAADIPFAIGVGADEFRKECGFGKTLSDSIIKNSGGKITTVRSSEADQVLEIVVIHIHAIGGGGFSGHKWARIQGRLKRGDNLIGSFEMQRTTGSGMRFSACSAMEPVAIVLGEDVAKWSRNPTIEATVR
jgi:hypothetical protein